MGKLRALYRPYIKNRYVVWSTILSFVLLIASLFINYMAVVYTTERASNPVTDIVLSNTPAFDVDGVFVFGPIIFWIFIGLVVLSRPRRIPFVLQSIALFVFIRSFFICLTHIGPYPIEAVIDHPSILKYFTSGSDLFFSAHTGTPFLMALIFWEHPYVRDICLLSAVLFGAVVLLGHYHYSIDVASAFFITYTIFHIAKYIFKEEWHLFRFGLHTDHTARAESKAYIAP